MNVLLSNPKGIIRLHADDIVVGIDVGNDLPEIELKQNSKL